LRDKQLRKLEAILAKNRIAFSQFNRSYTSEDWCSLIEQDVDFKFTKNGRVQQAKGFNSAIKKVKYIDYKGSQLSTWRLRWLVDTCVNNSCMVSDHKIHLYSQLLRKTVGDDYVKLIQYLVDENCITLVKDYSIEAGKSRLYFVDQQRTINLLAQLAEVTKENTYYNRLVEKDINKVAASNEAAIQELVSSGMSEGRARSIQNVNIEVTNKYNELMGTNILPKITFGLSDTREEEKRHRRIYTTAGNIPKKYRAQCFDDRVFFDLGKAYPLLASIACGSDEMRRLVEDEDTDFYVGVGKLLITSGSQQAVKATIMSLVKKDGLLDDYSHSFGHQELIDHITNSNNSNNTNYNSQEEANGGAASTMYPCFSDMLLDPCFIRRLGKHVCVAGINESLRKNGEIPPRMQVLLDYVSEQSGWAAGARLEDWYRGLDKTAFYSLSDSEWDLIQNTLGERLFEVGIETFTIHDAVCVAAKDVKKLKSIMDELWEGGKLPVKPASFHVEEFEQDQTFEEKLGGLLKEKAAATEGNLLHSFYEAMVTGSPKDTKVPEVRAEKEEPPVASCGLGQGELLERLRNGLSSLN
jgi:hypothetical protein